MSNVELLWRQFFANPSQWWDRRKRKTNPKAPDFKHKSTRQSLWVDGPNNPGWVKLMLEEKSKADSGNEADTVHTKSSMWENYFRDPTMWWDNRMTKRNPKAPDFKHKAAKQALWLADSSNPEWVVARFAKEPQMQGMSEVGNPHILACGLPMEWKQKESGKSCCTSLAIEMDVDKTKAKEIFDWKSLSAEQAVALLEEQSKPPSGESLIIILRKCRRKRSLVYAKRAHTYVCKNHIKFNTELSNHLVAMFVDCGGLHDAQQVFDSLTHRNELSWSSLIHGYCECGDFQQALDLYEEMQEHSLHPSPWTFLSVLKACVRLKNAERGKEMHYRIVILGYEQEGSIGNLLVDMYVKFGLLAEAQEVLLGLPNRDVVAWTPLLTGYGELGLSEQVWSCLEMMHMEGVSPDATAHLCSLKAFSNAGAIDYGRDVHCQVIMGGFEENYSIGNTLVDLYAKCGFWMEAWEVFSKMPIQGVLPWTALMAGHARQGECEMVFELFEEMRSQGVCPNDTTFLIVLSVCNHAGMVEKGLFYFELMRKEYSIVPTINHHNCMLDLLSRSGQLNAAMLMLENMSVTPNVVSWKTILSACRNWGNIEIAKQAYDLATRKGMNQPSVLRLMCSIFGDAKIQRRVSNFIPWRAHTQ